MSGYEVAAILIGIAVATPLIIFLVMTACFLLAIVAAAVSDWWNNK